MPRLVMMRHAAAGFSGGEDFRRELTVEGRRQATTQGARLREFCGDFDTAIVSDAVRARQTLEGLRSGGLHAANTRFESALYYEGFDSLLSLIRSYDAGASLLVIGHEPTMSLAARLLANEPLGELRFGFSTAMAVAGRVVSYASLERGGMILEQIIRCP